MKEVLVPSRTLYALEYSKGSSRGRRINTGQTTKFAAQEWLKNRIRERRGPYSSTRKTVPDAVDEWLEELRLKRRAKKRLCDYRCQSRFWIEFLEDRQVSDVTRKDIVDFLGKRESGQIGRSPIETPERPPAEYELDPPACLLSLGEETGLHRDESDGRPREMGRAQEGASHPHARRSRQTS